MESPTPSASNRRNTGRNSSGNSTAASDKLSLWQQSIRYLVALLAAANVDVPFGEASRALSQAGWTPRTKTEDPVQYAQSAEAAVSRAFQSLMAGYDADAY